MKKDVLVTIVGIILILVGTVGSVIVYLEILGLSSGVVQNSDLSPIFRAGYEAGASNVPIYLGLMVVAGAILLKGKEKDV